MRLMRTLCGAVVLQEERYLVDERPVSILSTYLLDMQELTTQSAQEPHNFKVYPLVGRKQAKIALSNP